MAKQETFFKKGQRVRIFHDPAECMRLEGEATLLRFKYTGGDYFGRRQEWWEVKFVDGSKGVRKLVEPSARPFEEFPKGKGLKGRLGSSPIIEEKS